MVAGRVDPPTASARRTHAPRSTPRSTPRTPKARVASWRRLCLRAIEWIMDCVTRSSAGSALVVLAGDAWMGVFADWWWCKVRPPTTLSDETLPGGTWSEAVCGVEVRQCENSHKGKGAFATRAFKNGCTVGVYTGEKMTRREYLLRHRGQRPANETELASYREREMRLNGLPDGEVTGGMRNNGV